MSEVIHKAAGPSNLTACGKQRAGMDSNLVHVVTCRDCIQEWLYKQATKAPNQRSKSVTAWQSRLQQLQRGLH